jgi:hypothetical protein
MSEDKLTQQDLDGFFKDDPDNKLYAAPTKENIPLSDLTKV